MVSFVASPIPRNIVNMTRNTEGERKTDTLFLARRVAESGEVCRTQYFNAR